MQRHVSAPSAPVQPACTAKGLPSGERECCEAPACLPGRRVQHAHKRAPLLVVGSFMPAPIGALRGVRFVPPVTQRAPLSSQLACLDWWPIIFPLRSCSPVVVVVVAHVLEQRLTRLGPVLVRVCLRVRCLSYLLSVCEALTVTLVVQFSMRGAALSALGFGVSCTADPQQHSSRLGGTASLIC